MEVILFRTFSHVIIMTWKVDPHAEGGTGIFIKESSIKVKDARRVRKSSTDVIIIVSVLF